MQQSGIRPTLPPSLPESWLRFPQVALGRKNPAADMYRPPGREPTGFDQPGNPDSVERCRSEKTCLEMNFL